MPRASEVDEAIGSAHRTERNAAPSARAKENAGAGAHTQQAKYCV
jgi:hypothetical protein